MDAEFGNSQIVATLGLSLFVFGLGLSPMILGPLSEFYGRRPIYIFGYIFFTIWLLPCAFGKNIETMLVARFLDGFSGSAFLSVAGGTVGESPSFRRLLGCRRSYCLFVLSSLSVPASAVQANENPQAICSTEINFKLQ